VATKTPLMHDVILALGDAQRAVPVLLKQVAFQDEVTTTFRLELESRRIDLLFDALAAIDVRLQLATLFAQGIEESTQLDLGSLRGLKADFREAGWEIVSVKLSSLDTALQAKGNRFGPVLSKAWTALQVLAVLATLTGHSLKDVIPANYVINIPSVVSASQEQYEAAGRFVDDLVGQMPRSMTLEAEITDARGERLVFRITTRG